MKWVTLTGRVREIPTAGYAVDWDGDQGSQFSAEVLDWLFPYWKNDPVLAEFPVAGMPRCRFDFVNVRRKVILETDGKQHDQYSPHFHGNRAALGAQFKRDMDKDAIARLNGFKMVRVKPGDLPLTREWFKATFDIDL